MTDDELAKVMKEAREALEALLKQPPKPPLELVSVADRNVPKQERIWLRAHENVRLNDYLLLVGLSAGEQFGFIPFLDYLFWLGDHSVDAGTWVCVFTGPGQTHVTRDTKSGFPIIQLFWGRTETVFTWEHIVPVLLRPARELMQIGKIGQ